MPFLYIPPSERSYFYLCEGIRVFETLETAQSFAKVGMAETSEVYFSTLNQHHWQIVELQADGSEVFHGRIVYHPMASS